MIEDIDKLLAGRGLPGVIELGALLDDLFGGASAARLIEQQPLQGGGRRVYRLRFAGNGQSRSAVIKRLRPDIARRNKLVTNRWLPAIGLDRCAPALLGSAAARSGQCEWQVYEDLGAWELGAREPDRDRMMVAVDLIARMHTRFARHALLGEVRLYGGDLGIHFYETNVNDAIVALEATQGLTVGDRLLDRLRQLRRELPERARAVGRFGGPETLLHGDLWAVNVFVVPTAAGLEARLIDWDHAAVGPATYDLSTLLLRLPAEYRSWLLERYRVAVGLAGWALPSDHELNFVFETHELARLANLIIWPAIALSVDHADWAEGELVEIERWFVQLGPVLPLADPKASHEAASHA